MVFRNLCALVLWKKVASALLGLMLGAAKNRRDNFAEVFLPQVFEKIFVEELIITNNIFLNILKNNLSFHVIAKVSKVLTAISRLLF